MTLWGSDVTHLKLLRFYAGLIRKKKKNDAHVYKSPYLLERIPSDENIGYKKGLSIKRRRAMAVINFIFLARIRDRLRLWAHTIMRDLASAFAAYTPAPLNLPVVFMARLWYRYSPVQT
jgi:hypothetical protein